MVRYQRCHQTFKKGLYINALSEKNEESQHIFGDFVFSKRRKPNLITLLFLSLLSCSLIFASHFLNFPYDSSFLYTFGHEDKTIVGETYVNPLPWSSVPNDTFGHEDKTIVDSETYGNPLLWSSVPNGTILCDRRSTRSDICTMKGEVRTHSLSSSLYIYSSKKIKGLLSNYEPNTKLETDEEEFQHEKIRPYTRKWEENVMSTVDELNLISKNQNSKYKLMCDVRHDVPAVFFSTGGYTGNVYHEFNDGILPLYITSQHFNKRVVFVILEYHDWWYMKYQEIISQLSDFPVIDFSKDKNVHCFPEAIVGLRIHNELSIDPLLMESGESIMDFRALLDKSYQSRAKRIIREEKPSSPKHSRKVKKQLLKPKLVIISRDGSRAIINQRLLVKMAEKIGFVVEVFKPVKTSTLANIYHLLNSSDVMIGVHGAAMTHLLFMRPASVFIQVVPLGTVWASEAYYGEPAKKLGLKYINYKIHPRESSLYDRYPKDDPILTNPDSLGKKGWEFTKKIFLDHQNVRLNLGRFRKQLVQSYKYSFAKKNSLGHARRSIKN